MARAQYQSNPLAHRDMLQHAALGQARAENGGLHLLADSAGAALGGMKQQLLASLYMYPPAAQPTTVPGLTLENTRLRLEASLVGGRAQAAMGALELASHRVLVGCSRRHRGCG